MKRIFLLLSLFIATFFYASAQEVTLPRTSAPVASDMLQRGNWMVGGSVGSLGFNFSTNVYQMNVFPTAGYFLSDRFILGAQTMFSLIAMEGGSDVSFGLSPFVRYYLGAGARDTGRWFGEVNLGGAGSALRDRDTDRLLSVMLGLRAGYSHFVASNVAFEGSVGYTFTEADIASPTNISGLGVVFGFQIFLRGRRNL